MTHSGATLLCFGPFTLDLAAAQLRRDGTEVALRPKAYDLLVALARRPQQLVTKEELLDSVWGRRFITEGVIKSSVSELRQALGDDPKAPRWIETVARRGYRFGGTLSASPTTRRVDPTIVTPAGQPSPSPGNVQSPLSPVIGRDAELQALNTLLPARRLLTLTGPAGMGKTRLALAVAWAQRTAWRDGVWFVELAALATDASADGAGAAALRAVLVQALQLYSGASASADTLARALQPLHLLLVLDNAEHLLAPLAPLLTLLLAQASGLHVLVTSQEPLHIAAEQVSRLAPLSLPAVSDDHSTEQLMACGAVRLFVARVADRLPGFSLKPQQQQAVAQICRDLDGMPLALELAAARVPVLGVHGMADLLQAGGDRLHLLNQGQRTAAPRQRTLRGALQWSHELLDERQRRVLHRLAVFRGGFALAQAQAVCSDDTLDRWGVLDAVQALVDKSLLTATAGTAATPAAAAPRLRLLESVRAFALEKLSEAGEEQATAARHLQAVADYWQAADADAIDQPALYWLALHGAEVDNLRAALQWACADGQRQAHAGALLRLAMHTATLWQRAGAAAEGRSLCELAKSGLPEAALCDPALSPGLDLAQAILTVYANAYPPAHGLLCARRAADGFASLGDLQRSGYALYLAYLTGLRVDGTVPQSALLDRMRASAAQSDGQGDDGAAGHFGLPRYLRAAEGYEHRRAGRGAEYLAYCSDELAHCQRGGAVVEGWAAAHGLMLAEHDAGRRQAALATGRQALAEIRAHGRLRQYGAFFALWTTMLAESGDSAGTRLAFVELLPSLRGAGTLWMAHVALAWLSAQESRPAVAARLLGWHDAAQETQVRARDGGTIDRSVQALDKRLHDALGASQLAQERARGASLDDAAAEALALRTEG